MDLVKQFVRQGMAFEAAYKDGGWDRLRDFYSPDIVYAVSNMPFHCEINGIDNFLAGFVRATDGFDKKCVREIYVGAFTLVQEDHKVLFHSFIRFTRDDHPPIQSGLWEIAIFENGLITHLTD